MELSHILTIGTGVITLAVASTYLAPRHVHVERSQIVKASPAEIIKLASSNVGYQQFNPYKASDPNLKIDLFGPVEGVGSGFRFDGKEGKGTQTVASVSDNKVVFQLDLGAMGKPTQAIEVKAVPGGTEITWSMDADMGKNPIARVVGLFMDGMMGKVFTSGLSNLNTATTL